MLKKKILNPPPQPNTMTESISHRDNLNNTNSRPPSVAGRGGYGARPKNHFKLRLLFRMGGGRADADRLGKSPQRAGAMLPHVICDKTSKAKKKTVKHELQHFYLQNLTLYIHDSFSTIIIQVHRKPIFHNVTTTFRV